MINKLSVFVNVDTGYLRVQRRLDTYLLLNLEDNLLKKDCLDWGIDEVS